MDKLLDIVFAVAVGAGMIIVFWGIIYGFLHNVYAAGYFIRLKMLLGSLQRDITEDKVRRYLHFIKMLKPAVVHNYNSLQELLHQGHSLLTASGAVEDKYKRQLEEIYERLRVDQD